MKLKKGDTVKVLSGNDKGKTGDIEQVFPKENKIIVKSVNVRKKATKPNKNNQNGGIIEKEFPINASIVQVVCPKCGKTARIHYKIDGENKIRVCSKCGAELKK